MGEFDNNCSRRTVLKAAAATGAVGIAGCLGDEENGVQDITALGGDSGGAGYQMCLAFESAIEASDLDIRVTVSGTDGWGANASMMYDSGQDELGIVPGGDVFDMVRHEGDYAEEGHYVTQMFPSVPPNWVHIIALEDSGMETWSDLNGADVNVLARGTLAEETIPPALEAIGVEVNEFYHYPHDDARSAIVQGDVDAVGAGGVAAAYLELSQQEDIRVLTVEEEDQEAIQEAMPFLEFDTEDFDNHYEGGGEATVPVDPTVMGALLSLDDDLVYDMTRAMFENLDAAESTYADAGRLDPETIADTTVVLHPGARNFYEEEGVDVPDEVSIDSEEDLPLQD
jgi:hypothetical protein